MNNQKGFAPIAIILIIIGVLALGGGAWYVKEKKKTEEIKKQAEELAQNQQVNQQEAQQVNQDETKDWQTYRNENYGFEVKYPSDLNYYIKENPARGPEPISFYKDNKSTTFFSIFISPYLEKKSLESSFEEKIKKGSFEHAESCEMPNISSLLNGGFFVSIECYNVSGIKNLHYGGVFENIKASPVLQLDEEYNDIVQIYIRFDSSANKNVNLINQILSTFKFIP